MTQSNIILFILAFILGSIQYQIRIRLSDVKEDVLRIMRYYSGRGERGSLSLNESINIMRDRLKKDKLNPKESKEYKDCIEEYDDMQRWLKRTGIHVPAVGLIAYLIYIVVLKWTGLT